MARRGKPRRISKPHIRNKNPPEDDGWVVVKKQAVTILVPPPPIDNQPGTNHPLPMPLKMLCPDDETKTSMPLACGPNVEAGPRFQAIINSTRSEPTYVEPPEGVRVSGFSKPPGRSVLVVHGPAGFLGNRVSPNQRLRVWNLERKLQRAGGVSQWLVSLGLAQFVGIFEGRRMGKFQLARLSTEKLKDMGAGAVGPRRKLMHALDCLCHPHCFQN